MVDNNISRIKLCLKKHHVKYEAQIFPFTWCFIADLIIGGDVT